MLNDCFCEWSLVASVTVYQMFVVKHEGSYSLPRSSISVGSTSGRNSDAGGRTVMVGRGCIAVHFVAAGCSTVDGTNISTHLFTDFHLL